MQIQELKQSYSTLVNDINQYIGESHVVEIKTWLMSATFKIWAGNKLCSEDYVGALSVFEKRRTYRKHENSVVDLSCGAGVI